METLRRRRSEPRPDQSVEPAAVAAAANVPEVGAEEEEGEQSFPPPQKRFLAQQEAEDKAVPEGDTMPGDLVLHGDEVVVFNVPQLKRAKLASSRSSSAE